MESLIRLKGCLLIDAAFQDPLITTASAAKDLYSVDGSPLQKHNILFNIAVFRIFCYVWLKE